MYNYIDIFLIFIDFNNNQYDNPVRYDNQILISINNQRVYEYMYLVSSTYGNKEK